MSTVKQSRRKFVPVDIPARSPLRRTAPVTWPLWAFSTMAMFVGLTAGTALGTYRQSNVTDTVRLDNARLDGKVTLLTNALKSQADLVARLDVPKTSAPPVTVAQPTAVVASAPVARINPDPVVKPAVAKPVVTAPAAKQPQPVAKPSPAAPVRVAPVVQPTSITTSKPAQAPATQQPAQTEPPQPKAAPTASHSGRIEGVTLDQAGISKIWADAVDFKSGTRVRVGETFPSGERLSGIDASTGRIITDQRQIIILDSK